MSDGLQADTHFKRYDAGSFKLMTVMVDFSKPRGKDCGLIIDDAQEFDAELDKEITQQLPPP